MNYGVLSGKRLVERPMRCKPGTKIRIINIHPDDPLFPQINSFRDQLAILSPTDPEKQYAQTEQICLHPVRRTFVACRVRMLSDGRFVEFKAVRFMRASVSVAKVYHNMKQGKDPYDRNIDV